MAKAFAIGIDLGTTYSCVGVYRNNHVDIIANDQGERTTPSYVSFSDDERLIGEAGKNQAAKNIHNTIFDAKRLIGRKFSDELVQLDMKMWPFKVAAGADDKAVIVVNLHGEEKQFHPEEISSMILAKMRDTANAYLGAKVTDAVVTVPAYFNDSQRQATKDAGQICGLNVLRVINEPTAAAIAYGLDKMGDHEGEQNVLIYDMGGGTFDVSLLTIEGGVFEVKATSGDTHLGGEDFDQHIVQYCVADFKRKHKVDISENPKALRKLRSQCERAKRSLSTNMKVDIELDALAEGVDYSICLTRARFEEINADILCKAITPVETVLAVSGLTKEQVDEIVLVGGSTRIPKVQALLQAFFNGKELCRKVNPDEAVAAGAAIQAAILMPDVPEEFEKVLLLDVTPLPLGVQVAGKETPDSQPTDGFFKTVMDKGTTLPAHKTMNFTTHTDNQERVRVTVFEGFGKKTKDNHRLGEFFCGGIPSAAKGTPKIEISFDVDADGILHVSATVTSTGKTVSMFITNDMGRLSKADIERMVAEGDQMQADDEAQRIRVEAWNGLELYCYNIRDSLEEALKDLDKLNKSTIQNAVNDVLEWLEQNKHAETDAFEAKQMELEGIVNPITMNTMTLGGGYEAGAGDQTVDEID